MLPWVVTFLTVVAGGKFQLVSNFTELHIDVLIPAAHSYMFLFSTDSQWMLHCLHRLVICIFGLASLIPRPHVGGKKWLASYPDYVGEEKCTQTTWEERNVPRLRGRRETYPDYVGREKSFSPSTRPWYKTNLGV